MDVQGFELPALAGCEGMLDRFAWIYVECWFMELYAGQALADAVIAWLRERERGLGLAGATTWPMTAKAARCRRIFCLGGAVWPRAVDCAGAIAARAPLLQDIGCRRPASGRWIANGIGDRSRRGRRFYGGGRRRWSRRGAAPTGWTCGAETCEHVTLKCYIILLLERPMSTTTIRLSDELKQRIRLAAERSGTTTHGFILQAIVEKTEQEALRQDFNETANQRYADIVASGETIPWQEMRRYLEQSMEGKRPARPAARKLAP